MASAHKLFSMPTNYKRHTLRSVGWNWRLELEWCERKILLGWLELEAGVM